MMQTSGCSPLPLNHPDRPTESNARSARLWRLLIVLLGIWIGQFILFGPSLLGRKILLPLDFLARPGVLIPLTSETVKLVTQDLIRSDLVLMGEPERIFMARELAAGRLPAWQPAQFAGIPLRSTLLSPLGLLKCSTPSPMILAWVQLVVATIAGLGMYRFSRSVAGVSFWAATIPAWGYPLSGALMLWQGFSLPEAICWFPWLLVAVERAVHRLSPSTVGGLALTSGLLLLAGQLDIAGLALIAAGIFGLWRIADLWIISRALPGVRKAVLALILGWGSGFLLAAPFLLPTLEHSSTGSRMEKRAEGAEERPPVGWTALPQALLPECYGTTKAGSFYMGDGNLPESAASNYAGVLATLLLAPLAWSSRRHRSFNALCAVFIALGLAWVVNCPGLVQLFRLPGLNMFSYNRFVFLSGFAILAQAAVGLEILARREFEWRKSFIIPVLVGVTLAGWSYYRSIVLPEPLATQLPEAAADGRAAHWASTLDEVVQIQETFRATSRAGGAVCALVLIGWLCLWRRSHWQFALGKAAALCLVVELLAFAAGQSVQCDPALYYPPIPALQQAAAAEPGRIVGHFALPANLAQTYNLQDVRGYDAIDPKRFVDLMLLADDARATRLPYAALQYFAPVLSWDDSGRLRLSPLLDLLGVRYVVFRGAPPATIKPDFMSPGYYVVKNQNAMPRAFVPRGVMVECDDARRLGRLASPDFDPRAVAYVESPVDLPAECLGEASVISDLPTQVTLALKMATPGLVVLGDRWDKGWNAYLDGQRTPILCVDHALRGVVAPAGDAKLDFRYEPAGRRWGFAACGMALAGLCLWSIWVHLPRRTLPNTLSSSAPSA